MAFMQRIRAEKCFRSTFYSVKPWEEYDEDSIRKIFRLGRDSVEFLANLLNDRLERRTNRNHALSVTDQILVALKFYASGDFFQNVGDFFGLEKGTVSRVVHTVSDELCNVKNQFIGFDLDKVEASKEKFFEDGGFPQVAGLIDGTHIRLQRPYEHEDAYINRKSYPSINCLVTTDADGEWSFTTNICLSPALNFVIDVLLYLLT